MDSDKEAVAVEVARPLSVEDLYDRAPVGYVTTSVDGVILRANATFLEWVGLTREALRQPTRIGDLVAPSSSIYLETHVVPLLQLQQEVKEIALELRCADGSDLPVLTNATVSLAEAEQPPVIDIVFFDARDRRAYERELVATRRDAERSHRQLNLLYRLVAEGTAATSVDDAVQRGADVIADELVASGVTLWLLDHTGAPRAVASSGRMPTEATGPRSGPSPDLASRLAIEEGEIVICESLDEATRHDVSVLDASSLPRLGAVVAVPIASGATTLGVCTVRFPRLRRLDDEDLHLFATIGRQLAQTVERARLDAELRHRALHDALTGVANRALFADRMAGALARSAREKTPLSVLLIDLDDFKLVNDTLGHAAGDSVLVAVSDRLTDVVRPYDTVARVGGDEFAVLCDEADGQVASALAERIRAVLHEPVVHDDAEIQISASIGLAVKSPSSTGHDIDSLLAIADEAMYRAKTSGKDSVQVGPTED